MSQESLEKGHENRSVNSQQHEAANVLRDCVSHNHVLKEDVQQDLSTIFRDGKLIATRTQDKFGQTVDFNVGNQEFIKMSGHGGSGLYRKLAEGQREVRDKMTYKSAMKVLHSLDFDGLECKK